MKFVQNPKTDVRAKDKCPQRSRSFEELEG